MEIRNCINIIEWITVESVIAGRLPKCRMVALIGNMSLRDKNNTTKTYLSELGCVVKLFFKKEGNIL